MSSLYVHMKRIICSFLLLLYVCVIYAEKIAYLTQAIGSEWLYFIKPYAVPSVQQKAKSSIIDITYITGQDSIDLRMTILLEDKIQPQVLAVVCENDTIQYSCDMLYVEREKKWWKYRIQSRIPYQVLENMYTGDRSYVIYVMDTVKNRFAYLHNGRQWLNLRSQFMEIIYLLNANSLSNRTGR